MAMCSAALDARYLRLLHANKTKHVGCSFCWVCASRRAHARESSVKTDLRGQPWQLLLRRATMPKGSQSVRTG